FGMSRMTVSRLLRLGPSEVIGRGRLEVSKRLDRLRLAHGASHDAGVVFGHLARTRELDAIARDAQNGGRPAAVDRLFEWWRAAGARSFFEGAVHPDTPAVLDHDMGEARTQVLAAADAICRGEFDLLGYRSLRFGDPIDWHLDPVSGRRAPLCHWSTL